MNTATARSFTIGRAAHATIRFRNRLYPERIAEIHRHRGRDVLSVHGSTPTVLVNDLIIDGDHELQPGDCIRIGKRRIHWNDYRYEGDAQELHLRDLLSYRGRVSRSNFRTISLLYIGLIIFIFFTPGLLTTYVSRAGQFSPAEQVALFDQLAIPLYLIAYGGLALLGCLLAVKRSRDAGLSPLTLFLPGYNLYALFVKPSKRYT